MYKAAPLVGLEYIVEVLQQTGDPQYNCVMCKFISGPADIMYHLLSAQHRLFYLVSSFLPFIIIIIYIIYFLGAFFLL